jgi:hypothetical protein
MTTTTALLLGVWVLATVALLRYLFTPRRVKGYDRWGAPPHQHRQWSETAAGDRFMADLMNREGERLIREGEQMLIGLRKEHPEGHWTIESVQGAVDRVRASQQEIALDSLMDSIGARFTSRSEEPE